MSVQLTQKSLTSLFYFHIGDTFSIIQHSHIWERLINPIYEDDTWDIEFLPVRLRPPRCERLDEMVINMIDHYMDEIYEVTMNKSHEHDRDGKVWDGSSTKDCLIKLFREQWLGEPYEEYEDEIASVGMREDSVDYSEDPDSNDSEDSISSKESYSMDMNEMRERNNQLWQGL
jgi:hypothetical protein